MNILIPFAYSNLAEETIIRIRAAIVFHDTHSWAVNNGYVPLCALVG